MRNQSENTRLTIDIPTSDHRKLKSLAAMLGTPMREVVCNLIHSSLYISDTPNEETLQAMENVENGKELTLCSNIEDMFIKLEI